MEQYYYLTMPGEATFDVAALARELDGSRSVFRRPGCEELTFVVCDNPELAEYVEGRLVKDPQKCLDAQGLITLRPDRIFVYQSGIPAIMDQIEAFALPLIKQCSCNVADELGRDITDRYRNQPEKLFRP